MNEPCLRLCDLLRQSYPAWLEQTELEKKFTIEEWKLLYFVMDSLVEVGLIQREIGAQCRYRYIMRSDEKPQTQPQIFKKSTLKLKTIREEKSRSKSLIIPKSK